MDSRTAKRRRKNDRSESPKFSESGYSGCRGPVPGCANQFGAGWQSAALCRRSGPMAGFRCSTAAILSGWYSMLANSGGDVAEKARHRADGRRHASRLRQRRLTAGPARKAGYLATVQEFGNVHIRVEFKWGLKRFPPAFSRASATAACCMACKVGVADKVWPTCVECQIEEGDVGDFFPPRRGSRRPGWSRSGLLWRGAGAKWMAGAHAGAGGPRAGAAPEPTGGRKIKDGNFEVLDGLERRRGDLARCDRAANIVNGRTVNS